MKFSKVLQRLASELPELDSMFLRYKALKKQLKSIPAQEGVSKQQGADGTDPPSQGYMSVEEEHFIETLNQDLARFNKFFIEREEEAVIQLQFLQERLSKARSSDVLSSLVDFHGQAVLLLHWSLLNYAAVAKILKKHDKRTGVLLRAPYLASCLQQPFNSTTIMSRLVREAEQLLSGSLMHHHTNNTSNTTAITSGGAAATSSGVGSGAQGQQQQQGQHLNGNSDDEGSSLTAVSDSALFRRTRLALETWDTLSRTAHTPSTVLLEPPPALTHPALAAGAAARPIGTATPPPPGTVAPILTVVGRPIPVALVPCVPVPVTLGPGLPDLPPLLRLGSFGTVQPAAAVPAVPASAPLRVGPDASLGLVRSTMEEEEGPDAACSPPMSPAACEAATPNVKARRGIPAAPVRDLVGLNRESDTTMVACGGGGAIDDPFKRDSKRSFASMSYAGEEEGEEVDGGATSGGHGVHQQHASHRLCLRSPGSVDDHDDQDDDDVQVA